MAAASEILLKGGYVLAMDDAGDIPHGDVLIRDVAEVTASARSALAGVLSRA